MPMYNLADRLNMDRNIPAMGLCLRRRWIRCSRCSALVVVLLLSLYNGATANLGSDLTARQIERCRNDTDHCPPLQSNISVIRINATSAMMSWTYTTGPSSMNIGAVRMLWLRVTLLGNQRQLIVDTNLPPTQTNYTVTSLIPGINYELQVATANENGLNSGDGYFLATPDYLSLDCSSVLAANSRCVSAGSMARYRCSARGGPVLSVGWDRIPGSSVSQQSVPGGQNIIISIRNVQVSDNGRQHCVRSSAGAKQTVACFTLCVREPIQIRCRKTRACGRRHRFYETVTLSCLVSGLPTPNITWKFKGQPVANTTNNPYDWHMLPQRQVLSTSLHGDFVPQSPVYQYRLKTNYTLPRFHTGTAEIAASNGFDQAALKQDIIITRSPTQMVEVLVVDKLRPDINLNDPFTVRCRSFMGVGNHHFTWWFTAKGSSKKRMIANGRDGVHISSSGVDSYLRYQYANISHSGIYQCTVKQNGCKKSAYTSVQIKAHLLSEIKNTDGFIFQELHRPADVTCTVTAAVTTVPPAVRWFLNSQEIYPSDGHLGGMLHHHRRTVYTSSWRAQQAPSYALGNTYRYVIRTSNLSIDDLGRLKCITTLNNKKHTSNVTLLARGVVVVITEAPRVIKLKRGRLVRLTCTVFSSQRRYATDVQGAEWLVRKRTALRAPRPVKGQGDTQVVDESTDPKAAGGVYMKKITMTIDGFQAMHQGLYICRTASQDKRRTTGLRMQAVVRLKLNSANTRPEQIMLMNG